MCSTRIHVKNYRPDVASPGSSVRPRTVRYLDWGLWLGILLLSTFIMRIARPGIEQAHASLVYILIVLGAAAGGERWLGILVAVLGFLGINYFFQSPFDTLTVAAPLDFVALLSFLSRSEEHTSELQS